MNATLPLVMAQALAPFAPPSSVVHQIVQEARELSEAECRAIDTAMHADKMVDGYGQRNYLAAMIDQMRRSA